MPTFRSLRQDGIMRRGVLIACTRCWEWWSISWGFGKPQMRARIPSDRNPEAVTSHRPSRESRTSRVGVIWSVRYPSRNAKDILFTILTGAGAQDQSGWCAHQFRSTEIRALLAQPSFITSSINTRPALIPLTLPED